MTLRVYNARNTPALTQQNTLNKGAVTHEIVRQLGLVTLEQYLQRELNVNESVRLKELATVAISITIGNSLDYVGQWSYL